MTYEERVKAWGDEGALEAFYTIAGKHLSDGVKPALADQQAWIAVSRLRRERGER